MCCIRGIAAVFGMVAKMALTGEASAASHLAPLASAARTYICQLHSSNELIRTIVVVCHLLPRTLILAIPRAYIYLP